MANEHRQERIEEEVMDKLVDGSDAALHAHNERLQAHGQVESGTYYRYVDSEPEHHNDFLTTYDDVVAEVDSDAPTRTLWSDAWGRLKKNRLAIIGACWIIFMVVVALTADLWAQQLLGSPTEIDTAQADAMIAAAEDFNVRLAETGVHFPMSQELEEEYQQLLNLGGSGIMGYVEIPSIKVYLPIYHGT